MAARPYNSAEGHVYDEPADIIASHRAHLDTLGFLIGDASDEVTSGSAWSIGEIVNHLLETERRFIFRVRRMRRETDPRMRVMPDPDYRKIPVLTAWRRFHETRTAHIRLLSKLKPEDWNRGGHLDPVGDITIASLSRHLVAHDAMHIGQIVERLSGRSG